MVVPGLLPATTIASFAIAALGAYLTQIFIWLSLGKAILIGMPSPAGGIMWTTVMTLANAAIFMPEIESHLLVVLSFLP